MYYNLPCALSCTMFLACTIIPWCCQTTVFIQTSILPFSSPFLVLSGVLSPVIITKQFEAKCLLCCEMNITTPLPPPVYSLILSNCQCFKLFLHPFFLFPQTFLCLELFPFNTFFPLQPSSSWFLVVFHCDFTAISPEGSNSAVN